LFRELHEVDDLKTAGSEPQLKQFLNEWVSEKILYERAKDSGLDRDPKYIEKIRPIKENWLVKLLIRQNVDEKIAIKRKDMDRYYEEHQEQFMSPATYSYYRIFFSNDVHGRETAEARAKECWGALDKGANFHDLVDDFSDTPTDRRYLLYGPFRAGENAAEIEEVIMQTQVHRHSPVVILPNGYMILYPDSKAEAVAKPFESAKQTIIQDLFDQRRAALLGDFLKDIGAQYKVEPNRELLDQTGVDDGKTILVINPGGTYCTWGEFQEFVKNRKAESRSEIDAAFEEFAKQMLLLHHAKHTDFEKATYFHSRYRTAEMRVLSDYLLELTVDPEVEPTDDEVAAFYEENRAAFRRPARMEAWHLVRTIPIPVNASDLDRVNATQQTFNQVLQVREFIAEEGGSFVTMADRFTEYEDGGYLGFVPLMAMPPEWVSVVAPLEEGEISQPIKVKDTFELVMRGKYEEPGVVKLSNVRELAHEKTREKMVAEARAEVLDRILIDMGVQMDTRPLSDLMARLAERADQPPRYWLDPYR
jgi:parvulin-like peptidyl-prolyl isomerase